MAGQYGTKELMDYAKALNTAGEQLSKVAEDGNIDLWDLRHIPPLLQAAKDAADGTPMAKLEMKELSKEEMTQVVEAFIAGGANLIKGVNALMATMDKKK